MKWVSWPLKFCYLYLLISMVDAGLDNPYETLGVHRTATLQEIRQAYKQLAKEWHPDKSREAQAEERFVQIKQAYELLSDPERRRLFDNRGITEEDALKKLDKTSFFTSSPLEDLFSQHGGYFNFQENDIVFFHKHSITTKQYDKIIVPKSEKVPHLIFFYTDFCFPCLQTAPYCRRLLDILEPLGINFVTVHSERESSLNRRLNVHTLPCLVLLLDGNVFVYKETISSIPKIIQFIRNKMPYKLVSQITTSNLESFLGGWKDNRVRGLILEPHENIRLRYLVAAYHFRHRVAFGFTDSPDILQLYQAPEDMDTILLFNENITFPLARITMKNIPTNTLHNVITSNQYLALPRLSSQKILEALCPCEWHKPRKRLCVVLVTEDTTDHDGHRQSFREFAQDSPYNVEKVRFAYIYHSKQSHFIKAMMPGDQYVEPLLRIVIFWRRDTTHLKYEWVSAQWREDTSQVNKTTLKETIAKLAKTSEELAYEAYVTDLLDEYAIGIIGKMVQKIYHYGLSVYDDLSKEQILPALSILGTVLFIIGIGYLMSYLVAKEEEQLQKEKEQAKSGSSNNNNNSYQPELKLHELRSEKYNALVRLLKPGCRTILLILDMQSRQQLIPPFHKAVWPYRRNKTLMFGFMYIERGLSWYKELLQLSLGNERELNINPRNCVGTVLSLNGHRKYFCVFHAKHTECHRNKGTKAALISGKPLNKDCESGAFLGFNDSESSDTEHEEILLQGNLLDGLPNWLDRLFEGTTQRYHINYWPEFPIK